MKRTVLFSICVLVLIVMAGCEHTVKSYTHYFLYDTYTGSVDVFYSRPEGDSVLNDNTDISSFQVNAGTEVMLADIERVAYSEKYTRVTLSDSVTGWVETRVIRPRSVRMVQRSSMNGYDTHLTRAYTFGEELTNAGSPVIGKLALTDEFLSMFRRDYQDLVKPLYIALAGTGIIMMILWRLLSLRVARRRSLVNVMYVLLWLTFVVSFIIEIVLGCVCNPDPTKLIGHGFWEIAFNFIIVILSVLTLLLQWKVMPSLFSNLTPFEDIPGIKFRGKAIDHTKGNLALLAMLGFVMVLCMILWKGMVDVVFWIMVIVQTVESIFVIIDATKTKRYWKSVLYIILLPLFFSMFMVIILSFKTAIGLVFFGYAAVMGFLSDPQGFFDTVSNSRGSSSANPTSIQTSSGENLDIMEDYGNGRVLDSNGQVRRKVSDSSQIYKTLDE